MSRLTRARGDRRWDLWLRGTGVLAAAGIPVALFAPSHIPLVWLAVVGIPANGPISPVLPVAFEPLIIQAARYRPALEVTLVAWAVHLYMEYLNCHLYRWLLGRPALASLGERPWVRRMVAAFARAPFATTALVAMSPLPFWVIRVVALLRGYAIRRFMVATAIGRFPRLYLYAWLGNQLNIPGIALITLVVGSAVAAAVLSIRRRARARRPSHKEPT